MGLPEAIRRLGDKLPARFLPVIIKIPLALQEIPRVPPEGANGSEFPSKRDSPSGILGETSLHRETSSETFGRSFHSAPIPVLLGVRYTNGMVLNYRARAISYDGTTLRVLSPERLETGIAVTILAPFLTKVGSCSILSVTRNRERPGYFEIELKFSKKPVPAEMLIEDVATEAPLSFTPAGVSLAAQEFAVLLERGESQRFSQVLQQLHPKRRPFFGAVSALALMLLLQDKEILDIRRLLGLV